MTQQTLAAKSPLPAETKETILDTAELLFAAKGIDATSVRDITQAASVNLGAINYHFGTKDGLVAEVFSRRITPLNQSRLMKLNAVEALAGDDLLPLEDVLEAFILPMIEQHLSQKDSGHSFTRLLCRLFQEPNPEREAMVTKHFDELVRRFNTAVLRAVPELPPEEVFWSITFMFGASHQALDTWSRFDRNPFTCLPGEPKAKVLNRNELVQRLVAYAAAGIRGTVNLPG